MVLFRLCCLCPEPIGFVLANRLSCLPVPESGCFLVSAGNSVTKASSEGTVLEPFSDADSVFTDQSSRSESPASEPVWSHILKAQSRDIIHSDTLAEVASPHIQHSHHHHFQHHHHHHRRQVSDLSEPEFAGSLEVRGEANTGFTPRQIERGEEADGEEEEEEEEYERRREAAQRTGPATDESETEVQCYLLEHHYGPGGDCS